MSTTHPTGPLAVELEGLGRTFETREGPVVAVDRVDLRVATGEVVALLGPNGAGKTTTLDLLLGLVTPTRGSVRVLGGAPRGAVRRGEVSAVLQAGGLLPDLSVSETVRYVAATFGRGARDVDAVLDRAGLRDLARRRVSKCSGGEQQRLRFALALLPDPALLVLDEPTAGMDVSARRDFWSVMHAEADRGRTVVFATHYLEEAEAFARRTVMMARGRVVADGPTAEVRARATGRVVTARVADPATVRTSLAGRAATTVDVDGDRVVVRTADSDAVARTLLVDHAAHDLEVVAGSLEDAFLALTATATATATTDPTEEASR